MDPIIPDRFAYEAFTLAFRIQKILESNFIPQEPKEDLAEDCRRLKEKVDLLSRFQETQHPAQEMPNPPNAFFKPF